MTWATKRGGFMISVAGLFAAVLGWLFGPAFAKIVESLIGPSCQTRECSLPPPEGFALTFAIVFALVVILALRSRATVIHTMLVGGIALLAFGVVFAASNVVVPAR